MIALLALMSCATEAPDPADGLELLNPREQLIRLSVDLRGVHPSETELAAIEESPGLYDDYVDRYLEDPRFLDRIEELWNYQFLTRTGSSFFDPEEAGITTMDADRVADSVNDEPLKLIRYIVDNNLPWTELVLADYTMADPVVAAMWDTDYPSDATGWQPARYLDGRPHAGVLTMTTMWSRYPSAGVNANRHRANAVSAILLCDDYLARPVSFSRSQIDALTSGDPEEVIRDNATCQSCHSSMDPLAAHFFGFWWESEGGLVDQTTYYAEDEELWREYSGREPGYFGHPTANLNELAGYLADDERFTSCAVETVFEGLTQRDTSEADWSELATHTAAFRDGGLVMKDLVRSIVLSPEYITQDVLDDDALGDRLATVKTVSPSQLGTIIADKTGYEWTFSGRNGLERNDMGLVVLGGGIDSEFVTTPSYDPSVGMLFIQERLAQSAASHVVQHDLDPDRSDDAILLEFVTIEDTPENNPDAFAAQVFALYLEITGLPLDVDSKVPDQLAVLWKELYSVDADPEAAWAGVLSVILRDPRILFY